MQICSVMDSSLGAVHCLYTIDYASGSSCAGYAAEGNCREWLAPCYTYQSRICGWTQPPGFQAPIPACLQPSVIMQSTAMLQVCDDQP